MIRKNTLRWITGVIGLFIMMVIQTCDPGAGTTDEPPGKIRWVDRISDTLALPEQGIDAVAGMDGIIQLQWKALPDKDIFSYEIFLSVDNVNYFLAKTLRPGDAGVNQNFFYNLQDSVYTYFYDITELNPGGGDPFNKTHWFYILATDENSRISPPSDTIFYRLERSVGGLEIITENPGERKKFQWNWFNLIQPPNQIIIRIEREILPSTWNVELVKKLTAEDPVFHGEFYDSPGFYLNELESRFGFVPFTGKYRWRIDVYNDEWWGSESAWFVWQQN